MERTVYAVMIGDDDSSDDYSEYQVKGLFEDRADAERFAEMDPGQGCYSGIQVQPFTLFSGGEIPQVSP